MTFASSEAEMQEVWTRSPETRLFKLYDKACNLLDGTWMDGKKRKRYLDYARALADDVEKHFGTLDIMRLIRALELESGSKAKEDQLKNQTSENKPDRLTEALLSQKKAREETQVFHESMMKEIQRFVESDDAKACRKELWEAGSNQEFQFYSPGADDDSEQRNLAYFGYSGFRAYKLGSSGKLQSEVEYSIAAWNLKAMGLKPEQVFDWLRDQAARLLEEERAQKEKKKKAKRKDPKRDDGCASDDPSGAWPGFLCRS